MTGPLITLGHGRQERDELAALLRGARIAHLIDVRRFPGSRANEAAARGQVPELSSEVGIGYRWDERLGGRRRLTADEDAASPDAWWRVRAFRAYAAWTRTEDFRVGIADLVADVGEQRTAIMCAESVWWRCHRRIISDVVLLEHEIPVEHLMPDGRLTEHRPSDGARLGDDGRVVWDGGS